MCIRDSNNSVKVTEEVERTNEDQTTLRAGLFNAGFEVRRWRDTATNWPLVSPTTAMMWYRQFAKRHLSKDNCIINTKYNPKLNPVK